MSKEVRTVRRAVRQLPPGATDAYPANIAPLPDIPGSFVSFRYSYTEMARQGQQVHLKRRETRFDGTKLTSEECEGLLEPDAYHRMLRQTQPSLLGQVTELLKLFLAAPARGKAYRNE